MTFSKRASTPEVRRSAARVQHVCWQGCYGEQCLLFEWMEKGLSSSRISVSRSSLGQGCRSADPSVSYHYHCDVSRIFKILRSHKHFLRKLKYFIIILNLFVWLWTTSKCLVPSWWTLSSTAPTVGRRLLLCLRRQVFLRLRGRRSLTLPSAATSSPSACSRPPPPHSPCCTLRTRCTASTTPRWWDLCLCSTLWESHPTLPLTASDPRRSSLFIDLWRASSARRHLPTQSQVCP